MKNRSSLQTKQTSTHRLQQMMNLFRHWPIVVLAVIALTSIHYHQNKQTSLLRTEHVSWEAVQEQAKEQDQLCLLFFTSDYCYSCESVEELFRLHPDLQEIVKTGYQVKSFFPMEKEADQLVARRYEVKSLPAFLVTTHDGKLIREIPTEETAYQLTNLLERTYYLREVPSPSSLQANQASEPVFPSTPAPNQQWGIAYPPAQWSACVRQAEISRHEWNRGVWIQASSDRMYQVVLGAFEEAEEAETAAEVLRAWGKENELEVIPLPAGGLPLLGSL